MGILFSNYTNNSKIGCRMESLYNVCANNYNQNYNYYQRLTIHSLSKIFDNIKQPITSFIWCFISDYFEKRYMKLSGKNTVPGLWNEHGLRFRKVYTIGNIRVLYIYLYTVYALVVSILDHFPSSLAQAFIFVIASRRVTMIHVPHNP